MAKAPRSPLWIGTIHQLGLLFVQLNLGWISHVLLLDPGREVSSITLAIMVGAIVFTGWLSVKGMQAVSGTKDLILAAAQFRAAGNAPAIGGVQDLEPVPSAAPDQLPTPAPVAPLLGARARATVARERGPRRPPLPSPLPVLDPTEWRPPPSDEWPAGNGPLDKPRGPRRSGEDE